MFEHFSERARQVVVFAQEEARVLRHNYIGTEHILLGLLREEEGIAARVLESFDITFEQTRAMVEQIVGRGDEMTTPPIPFTPRAKKVLELSLREALSLGHIKIDTEHVLLGLARQKDGVAARILADLGADAEWLRDEVISSLARPQRPRQSLDWHEPEAYDPWAPALTDEFVDELERRRKEVVAAVEENDVERAADARYRYAALVSAARRLERVWRSEDDREEPEPLTPFVHVMAEATPIRMTYGAAQVPPRIARVEEATRRSLLRVGLFFGIAFALGTAAGWLIWG